MSMAMVCLDLSIIHNYIIYHAKLYFIGFDKEREQMKKQ